MKQLLVTLLAVIMSVSMASAAPSAKEIAEKKVAEVSASKESKEDAIKRMASDLVKDNAIKSDKILKTLEEVFPKNLDMQLKALALFAGAKEGTKEEQDLSKQVNYLFTMVSAGKVSALTANRLLNAAKLLLESDGVEAESVKKITNQIKRVTTTTYLAKKNGDKISEAEIDLLSFVNEVYQGADKKGSVGDVKDVTTEMKKAYEDWKNNCKG